MALPYYMKAEIRFECQYCGDCCWAWHGNVYVRTEDIPELAGAVRLMPGQFVIEYTRRDYLGDRHLVLKSNGHCIFYEDET